DRGVLPHELMHALVEHALPRAPDWLHEGLASYLETIDLKDGQAYVGAAPDRGILGLLVTAADVPSARSLLAADFLEFHGLTGKKSFFWGAAPADNAHYLGAWALAAILLEDPRHRATFDRALQDEAASPLTAIAYGRLFDAVGPATLEEQLR